MYKLTFRILFIALLLVRYAFSINPRIYVDGFFSDWSSLDTLYQDSAGDQIEGDLDFGTLKATNDDDYLYLYIETNSEINMQNDNDLTVYIDTDNDGSSGINIGGIGAELVWNFGDRYGLFSSASESYTIYQNAIGIVTAPTVSSDRFEIAIDRYAEPLDEIPLFSDTTISIFFRDRGPGQDLLPDNYQKALYTFSESTPAPLTPTTIREPDQGSCRIMTYNVLHDGIFDEERAPAFGRVLNAIQPDIIGFQEIYNHDHEDTKTFVESVLPLQDEEQWYSEKVNPDIIAVSKFPITESYYVEGNGAFILDLRTKFNCYMLFIVAHPPCCQNEEGRQYEIDAIMAFIREAKQPGAGLNLPENTPVLIVGDMNLVGYAQQLETLLTGEIVNHNEFGESFTPDWDGTDYTDLLPRHTNMSLFFTWYAEYSSYSPGRLDFIIYSDSVIEPVRSFVLFTPGMQHDSLDASGLISDDAIVASDHLPVVGDFVYTVLIDALDEFAETDPETFRLSQNYPNPFNSNTTIKYSCPSNTPVSICIYDLNGKEIKSFHINRNASMRGTITWNGKDKQNNSVASGIYICRLKSKSHSKSIKMLYSK